MGIRGPDDLIYPWGNEFKPENVVYNTGGSSFVGSKPAGNSWVGASDMSGNLREWVSSFYGRYPFNPDAARVTLSASGETQISVRGGEFGDNDPDALRGAFRHWADPDNVNHWHIGIRCARDYS